MKNLTRSATFGYLDRKFSNPPNSQDAAGASCKAGCSDSPCMRICGIRNNWAWQNMTKQNIYPNYRDHGLTFAAPAIAFSEDSESLEAHGSTGQLATFAELKTAPLTFDIHSLPLCSFQVRQLWQPKQILSDHETHKNTENTHPRFYSITAGMGWAAPSGLKARLGGRVLTETPLFWSRCDKWAVLISSIPKSPTHQSLCGNHTKIWKKTHTVHHLTSPFLVIMFCLKKLQLELPSSAPKISLAISCTAASVAALKRSPFAWASKRNEDAEVVEALLFSPERDVLGGEEALN